MIFNQKPSIRSVLILILLLTSLTGTITSPFNENNPTSPKVRTEADVQYNTIHLSKTMEKHNVKNIQNNHPVVNTKVNTNNQSIDLTSQLGLNSIQEGDDISVDNHGIFFDQTPANPTYVPENSNSYEIVWRGYTDDLTTPDDYEITQFSSIVKSGQWSNNERLFYDVSSLLNGTYEFTMTLYSFLRTKNEQNTIDLFVYNAFYDTINPQLTKTQNNISVSQDDPFTLSWNATDAYLDNYEIYRNGVSIAASGMSSGELIELNEAGKTEGIYNYTFVATDQNGNSIQDQAFVQVNEPPIFQTPLPTDVAYEAGTTGNTITWNVETEANPNRYEVFKNGSLIGFGSYSTGIDIVVNIDGFEFGLFNVTIKVFDTLGNYNTDLVYVDVSDSGLPTVNSPDDVTTQIKSGLVEINWNATDASADTFVILHNGTQIQSGIWETGTFTSPDFTYFDLGIGIHNLTAIFYDKKGQSVNDTVIVTIFDNVQPSLQDYQDTQIEQTSDQSIIWTPSDQLPGTYVLYENSNQTGSGSYDNSTQIIIDLSILNYGEYNFTIVVNDTSGNTVIDYVIITIVDTTGPVIQGDSSLVIEKGSQGNELSITVGDPNPDYYDLYLNETVQQANVSWVNQTLTFNYDNLDLGVYVYNFTFYDELGNNNTIIITITVQDTINPAIVSSPNDISTVYNLSDQYLEWEAIDVENDRWVIFLNGTQLDQGQWNSIIQYNTGDLPVGTHNFTIIIMDTSGNQITDTVMIEIQYDEFVINLENNVVTDVAEGDLQSVQVSLSSSNLGGTINSANISYSLSKSNIVYLSEYASLEDILYNIKLNYTGLTSGSYQLTINIEHTGFENRTLTYDIQVKQPTILVQIDRDPAFIKSEEYRINFTLQYGDNNGLSLNQYQQRSGPVALESIVVYIEVVINGKNETLSFNTMTDENGKASIVLDRDKTSTIEDIKKISLQVQRQINGEQIGIDIPQNQLPQVVEINESRFDKYIEYVQENLILVISISTAIISLFGILLFIGIRNKRKKENIRKRNLYADELLRTITHIRVMILQSNTGTTYFKLNLVKLGVDTNLIGGLTSAVSSFMAEISESETRGFEKVERDGLNILSHRSDYSALVLVSDRGIPAILLGKIQEAHQELENTFHQRLSSDTGRQISIEEFIPEIHQAGLPIALAGDLLMRNAEFERVRGSLDYTKEERNALLMLEPLFEKYTLGVKHEKIGEFLTTHGIDPHFVSYIVVKAFELGHIVPVTRDLEGTRRINLVDESEEGIPRIEGSETHDDLNSSDNTSDTQLSFEDDDLNESENSEFTDDDFNSMLDDVDNL